MGPLLIVRQQLVEEKGKKDEKNIIFYVFASSVI